MKLIIGGTCKHSYVSALKQILDLFKRKSVILKRLHRNSKYGRLIMRAPLQRPIERLIS